ncbi:MAG: TIGR02996 domain-containing protein [Gemmataceae bacterium]
MGEEDAFLRRLRAHPDDLDTLRVYADWLDDQGDDARAGFLRLQHQVLGMRPTQRGLVGKSRALARLGEALPERWLAVVSRPRLVGTCWAGNDSDGMRYVFRYLSRGKLNYTSPTGTFENATWRQVGNVVRMEMNRHYADYEGVIAGDRIRGGARNIDRRRWRWDVARTTDPEACDPGDPIRRVFDGHLRRGRRHRRRASAP